MSAKLKRISATQEIPTDADIKEGAKRLIPLDELRKPVILELSEEIEHQGKPLKEVTIYPPTTRQVKDMRRNKNTAEAIEHFIVACLQTWTPQETDALNPYDYGRIEKIVLGFM